MKLVRNKIAERHPQHEYRLALPFEFDALLRLKLMEEAGEAVSARNRDELLEELADLLEVLKELGLRSEISFGEVESRRATKAHRLGAFTEGLVLVDYKGD